MKQLIQVSRFFVFSNLLIAGAAVSQSLLSYILLKIPTNLYILLLEGSATLLLYNFSLWLSMPSDKTDSPYLRTKWFFANQSVFWTLTILAALIAIYSLFQLHRFTFLLLFIIGLLSLGYAVPIFRFRGKMVALRQIVGLKVFLIAIVWSLSVVGMPVTEFYSKGGFVEWQRVWFWAGLVALFILGITLPFDIRDLKQDQYYNLKTIPVFIGEKKSQMLCYTLVTAHLLLLLLLFHNSLPFYTGLLFTDILVLLAFKMYLFKQRASYESVYLLDLMLIVQLVLVYLFE